MLFTRSCFYKCYFGMCYAGPGYICSLQMHSICLCMQRMHSHACKNTEKHHCTNSRSLPHSIARRCSKATVQNLNQQTLSHNNITIPGPTTGSTLQVTRRPTPASHHTLACQQWRLSGPAHAHTQAHAYTHWNAEHQLLTLGH
jgi:hypothetical protein